MKIFRSVIFVFLIGAWLPITVVTFANQEVPDQSLLKGLDARKALKIANQWRWTKKEIKSYIDTREIVFKFPDGESTRIPLPENEVMVAVAPYIKKTHE